jgi:hypothetical protein
MKNPIKIIHKFKNNNLRTQYKIFIFIGSQLEDNIMKILRIIENKDFISSMLVLSDKQIKEITNFYGKDWYNKFFTSYHINAQRYIIKNNNAKKKLLETKMGKDWVKFLLDEPIIKKVSYSYAGSYFNYLLTKNKIGQNAKKVEMNFTTYETEYNKKLLDEIAQEQTKSLQLQQIGGEDDDDDDNNYSDDDLPEDTDLLENINPDAEQQTNIKEPVDKNEDEEEEKPITEDELDDAVEEDFDMDELTKLYSSTDAESDKLIKETSKLISEAVNDKKWDKSVDTLSSDYDESLDSLTFDSKLEDTYKKYYITNQYIFLDDTIKTMRNKIAVSIPGNPKFGKKIKLLPETQYFWTEYSFEGKIDQVMLGQKWIRRNELLRIDIKPNDNLKVYEKLRNNLAYLKDSFGYKIKREDDETNVIDYYDKFMTNNEIFMLDIYDEFGLNYSPESEDKRNLYEVYVNIYFPHITFERLEQILDLLKGKDTKELDYTENVFGTIKNDTKLETEIYENVERAKLNLGKYNELFFQNHIIQSIIHVNINDPKNITGTVSENKFNLYRIFDNFAVTQDYPFIQYQTPDTNITYKFYTKAEKIDSKEILSKWFENAPYGISVKVRQPDDKYISINIHETGRIEYKITFKEEDAAVIEDIYKTYDIVRNLLKKINSENKKIKFILPPDDRFKFAFINTIQKFTIPEKFRINHDDLSEFARFFFPYVSLVIEPKKRESKKVSTTDVETSKYGTYLRYKRISKYENRTKMHLRILYFLRNYELSDRELIDEVAKQFNITQDVAAKELDYVREKYIKVIKKSKKLLKHLKSLPRSKPPGIDISIQGRDRDRYKIRITGARDKNQLDEIIDFMKVLIYMYVETYLYKRKEFQKLKDILKTLSKIAKRRNKVIEIVDYDTTIKNVKIVTSLDKKRLGYKPEEGQNQWTRNCQNSGDDKKRRPDGIPSDQIENLVKKGYKLNDKNGFYERVVEVKTKGVVKKITLRAIKLSGENGKYNYYACNPDENQDHMYVGFLTKSNNPTDLCMPCCFKKDQLTSGNKFKMNYYKKCIGEKAQAVEEKQSVPTLGDKVYILQETNKVQDGRFIYLPKWLDIFFNQIWKHDQKIRNHYLLESKSGYFFKYTVRNDKYNFLAAIADVYDKTIPDLINLMASFLKTDKDNKYFTYLNNGDISESFNTIENYIDYLQTSNYLEYDIVGELLSIPGVVSKKGVYYYIMEKQTIVIKKALEKDTTKEKYYLICLNLENDYMKQEDRDIVILIKDGKYYFPIYRVQKDESKDKKIKLQKFYNKNDATDKIMSELASYYNKSCQNKLLNQISISNEICCKNILLDLENNNIKIKKQYIDNRNKCKYIQLENNILLPVKHSGISYKYPFSSINEITNSKLHNLKDTIKNIETLNKKLNKNYLGKSVFYDSLKNDNFKIVSLLLHNEIVVPIKHDIMSDKEIKKLGLSIRFQALEEDIDDEIRANKVIVDDRSYRVKDRIFKSEGYNIYRLELSYFLENNEDLKDKIINIVRNKTISSKEKKYELRKILFTIMDKKIISKYGLSGGAKKLSMSHIIKELPKLDDYLIYNVRDYCEINNNKDKCNTNIHCLWKEDSCKMQLTENMAVDYVNKVIEEIILDGIKFKEIIQESNYYVSDIVDYTQYSYRPNQKIIKSSNFTINKIMSELFGKDKVPTIGRKQIVTKDEQFVEEDYPELIELGKKLIQPIVSNNDSIIRAFINCLYWINNPLYDDVSRNLGYVSDLQTSLTYLFKANIIDFIQTNRNNPNVNKYLSNYFKNEENFFESAINKFRKSSFNTDGKIELYVISHLIDTPIVIYDNFYTVRYIFLQGEIKVTEDTIKNYVKEDKLNKTIFIKFDYDGSNKIPKNIYSIYYK